jgi:uncharacterized protein
MDAYYKEVDCHLGLGVFAARVFKKGEVVLCPTGRVISYQTIYSIQFDWNCHLDPDVPAKYLNHSCDPNLGVHTRFNGWPEFVALRDIARDEQITFDYAMTEFQHYTRDDPNLDFDLTCYCGTQNCRGRLGYYTELSPELRVKYKGYLSAYLLRGEPGQIPISQQEIP